jgi:hypothetical protein
VAWVVTVDWWIGSPKNAPHGLACYSGSVVAWFSADIGGPSIAGHSFPRQKWLGDFLLARGVLFPPINEAALPIPVMLTLVIPLSVAPFTRFRFPLWSYFAWTALLAAELAYYLR